MCSIDPDGVIEMTRATQVLDITKGDVMCRKCGEAAAEVVLRQKDAYCRSCFLAYFRHKFRSTLGKSKQIHPGDHVLVGVSGGSSSTALLHLITEGLQENSHKKLRFTPSFLYIDESVVCGEERDPAHTQRVVEQVCSLGFPCYVGALEHVMALQPQAPILVPQDCKEVQLATDEKLQEKCRQLFAACQSASAQQDLHDQLLQCLLRRCAQVLGFNKVFLGHNATSVSVCILSQVAMGRGAHLPHTVHFKTVTQGVEVYRPLRECLQEEVLHYLSLSNITTFNLPVFTPKGPSITNRTKDFILGLQREFPSTIPTIFRTGDKLAAVSAAEANHSHPGCTHEGNNVCILCGLELDTEKSEASALHAIVISRKYSQKSPDAADETKVGVTNQEDCQERSREMSQTCDAGANVCGGSCNKTSGTRVMASPQALQHYLCYGCRVTVKDMSQPGVLPPWVQADLTKQEQRKVMWEQIHDFML